MSAENKKEKSLNRRIFIKILENLSFLARQGLPLRGGNRDVESNFIQLLQLRSIDSPEIIPWMKKKASKYTSHDVQNECLQLMALNIIRQLSLDIRTSQFYTIMADECTDVSNHEQFTICIRWVSSCFEVNEYFIGLYQVDTIGAICLEHAIKDTLLRMGVNLSKCRGQCYDGASNMSGSKSGVSTRLQKEEKRAVYTHCYGHALNLAVGNIQSSSQKFVVKHWRWALKYVN